ncbi:MAG: baseplate J/gp47 family protein [Trueperaceae bacterium]|nr:baseplate J/gp47 family protein [Trueperaceae bacterium]
MSVDYPQLDTRDEDTVVADTIDDLPAILSDRNNSALAVKLLEACGTFYGSILYQLDQLPKALYLTLLDLVGITPAPATKATTPVTFTTSGATKPTIDAGTIVKTGPDADAVKFETDADIVSGDYSATGSVFEASVGATAVETGADGNVGANTLDTLESPIAGIDSVTNASAASGGDDEESTESLIDRAPELLRAKDRAVSQDDFERLAADQAGVERAIAAGDAGAVTVHILADDLNEVDNATLRGDVETYLDERTVPGVQVTANQYTTWLVNLSEIEIEYVAGADQSVTNDRITSALEGYVDALTWPYGGKLYLSEVIALVDQVEGVERVGDVYYQESTDYGSNWSGASQLTGGVEPGPGGGATQFHLWHYGTGYSKPSTTFTAL